jgi:tol-pal system protein YbgF
MTERPSLRPWLASGLLAVLAAGCASEVDLSSLRREQRDLARRLADTRADVESLRVQLSRLRGQIEDSSQRGRSTWSGGAPPPEIEERLRALEAGTTRPTEPLPGGELPPGAVPPGAEFGAPAVPPPPPPAETGQPVAVESDVGRSDNADYRTGLTQYQRGEHQKAVQTLKSVVNKNPKSESVPYAQYWIGEAYYSQGKYNEAILAYNEILVGWPKSDRVPAALLRQASAFAELGDKIDARLILQKLIAEHPGSPEAARAKRQLLALGS